MDDLAKFFQAVNMVVPELTKLVFVGSLETIKTEPLLFEYHQTGKTNGHVGLNRHT